MTYRRVIPRDLFNEANLLKCYGQLWLQLDQLRGHKAALGEGDGGPFEVVQDSADGSITIWSLPLIVDGHRIRLYRPLNSREPWPLYAETLDGEEIPVVAADGLLDAGFLALIRGDS